jgi:hypothetical protein
MSSLPLDIDLGPRDEADRLWRGALQARITADTSLVSLLEALELGLRSAEILAIAKLQTARDNFPATIALRLATPDPEVEAYRDAVEIPRSLTFTDLLDLLSEESLDCVSPRLHRGWEDRRFSCRRSRATAQQAVGVSFNAETREKLLLLSAYRNRVFRCQPPLRVRPTEILEGFDELTHLITQLRT